MKKEIELKYRLDSKLDLQLFEYLLDPYRTGEKQTLRQENYYFDTKMLSLKKQGISLRLRQEDDKFWLCAKQSLKGKKHGHNLSVRLEYQRPLSTDTATLIKQKKISAVDVFRKLNASSAEDQATRDTILDHMEHNFEGIIHMIGSFKNHRTIVPVSLLNHHLEIELDHSIYPGSVEVFEVEVEFSSVALAENMRGTLEALFRAGRIKTYASCSKSSRLYKIRFG
jgi:uncharacterized protein YjbK